MTYRAALLGLAIAAGLGLSACTKKSERVLFDGNYYPTKAKPAGKDDRKSFVVTVRRADQGLDGAREAGRHGGTGYCIREFGTSDIVWTRGPDAEDGTLEVAGGSLILRGDCVLW